MIKAYRRTSFRYDFIRENHEKEINFSFKFVSQEGKDKKKPHFKGLNLHFEFFNIKKESDFDYFDDDGFYELNLRVVRFKITKETYECLVTNLTRDEFDLNELKEMYHMRWNIETAFKMLKYIIGMMSFHSKKRNFIQQEIYAAILLHCLTNIITERIEVEQSDKRKHHYKVNLSTAVTNMRLWLRKIICTKEIIKRIKKYLAPVRPDRKYQRNMKPKSAIPFNTKAS